MKEQGKNPEHERRDWIVILIILLVGFLCVVLAGGWAIRFSPRWGLDTGMESNINPNDIFLTDHPNTFIEPLDSSILTQPVWANNNVFLTAGVTFPSSTPAPTNTSAPTQTPVPASPAPNTNTPLPTAIPTNTFIYYTAAPATSTPARMPTKTATGIPTSADLQITKTDHVATYGSTSGSNTVTYIIVVSNPGPANVTGAVVSDPKPSQVASWSWACMSQNNGASGCDTMSGSSNFTDTINLPKGSSISYTVTTTITIGSTGNLVNTASVSAPAGITDPNNANNSATDTDGYAPASISVDLQIAKTDSATTYTVGSTVTYTIVVTNNGPNNVTGATMSDSKPAQITTWGWCAIPCTPVANSSSDLSAVVNLASGSSITYTVLANTSSAATGSLVNTASVNVPSGYTDTDPSNNSATDGDTPVLSADLQITKTDGATDYVAGALKVYTITVLNAGPSDVTGATVTDLTLTNATNANLVGTIWGCSSANGGSCSPAFGIGNINNTVDLPSGSSIVYTVNALVVSNSPPGPPSGPLTNIAAVTVPAGVTDLVPGNNSATDTDQLVVINGTVASTPDGSVTNYLAGSYVTLQFGTPLNVGSGSPSYLVYYPSYPNPPGGPTLPMDLVILQIGDGSNWYTVFNWGNGFPDTNTDIPAFPPNSVNCTSEADNCPIDISLLTVNAPYPGVTIYIPASVPAGTYPYIRIISPAGGDSGDGLDVDAISILP